jgi:hypothetical protein
MIETVRDGQSLAKALLPPASAKLVAAPPARNDLREKWVDDLMLTFCLP